MDDPFRVLLTCCRVLATSQDPRAQAVLETAHTLLQDQAGGIADHRLRRSFLENVPAHRQLVAEAEKPTAERR